MRRFQKQGEKIMSKVREFYEALSKDEAMQERAKGLKAAAETTEEAAVEAVVAFAQAEGYAFTAGELKDARKELSDEELAAVAGGGAYQCYGGGMVTVNYYGKIDTCMCAVYGESSGFICCLIGKTMNAVDGARAFLDVVQYPLWKKW
jgi:predicted ribosomally synthesized peptide with nif11-like leader